MVNEAAPETFRVAVPNATLPSLKVTEPVAVGDVPVITAMNVTAEPGCEGEPLEASVITPVCSTDCGSAEEVLPAKFVLPA